MEREATYWQIEANITTLKDPSGHHTENSLFYTRLLERLRHIDELLLPLRESSAFSPPTSGHTPLVRRNASSISFESELEIEGTKLRSNVPAMEIDESKLQPKDSKIKSTVHEEINPDFTNRKTICDVGGDTTLKSSLLDISMSEVEESKVVEFELQHDRSDSLIESCKLHSLGYYQLPSVCENASKTSLPHNLDTNMVQSHQFNAVNCMRKENKSIEEIIIKGGLPLLHGEPSMLSFNHPQDVRQNAAPKTLTTTLFKPTSETSHVSNSSSIRLPEFYGDYLDGYKVESWIRNAEGIFNHFDVLEIQKVKFAALSLKGNAHQWYHGYRKQRHGIVIWTEFARDIVDQFIGTECSIEDIEINPLQGSCGTKLHFEITESLLNVTMEENALELGEVFEEAKQSCGQIFLMHEPASCRHAPNTLSCPILFHLVPIIPVTQQLASLTSTATLSHSHSIIRKIEKGVNSKLEPVMGLFGEPPDRGKDWKQGLVKLPRSLGDKHFLHPRYFHDKTGYYKQDSYQEKVTEGVLDSLISLRGKWDLTVSFSKGFYKVRIFSQIYDPCFAMKFSTATSWKVFELNREQHIKSCLETFPVFETTESYNSTNKSFYIPFSIRELIVASPGLQVSETLKNKLNLHTIVFYSFLGQNEIALFKFEVADSSILEFDHEEGPLVVWKKLIMRYYDVFHTKHYFSIRMRLNIQLRWKINQEAQWCPSVSEGPLICWFLWWEEYRGGVLFLKFLTVVIIQFHPPLRIVGSAKVSFKGCGQDEVNVSHVIVVHSMKQAKCNFEAYVVVDGPENVMRRIHIILKVAKRITIL